MKSEYLETLHYGMNCDLAVCSFEIEGSDEKWDSGIPTGELTIDQKRDILLNHIAQVEFSAVWCKLYKKDIIDKLVIRFDPKISTREDTLFFITYFASIESVYCVNRKLYRYNRGVDECQSLSKNMRLRGESWLRYIDGCTAPLLTLASRYDCAPAQLFEAMWFKNDMRPYMLRHKDNIADAIQDMHMCPLLDSFLMCSSSTDSRRLKLFRFLYRYNLNFMLTLYVTLCLKQNKKIF